MMWLLFLHSGCALIIVFFIHLVNQIKGMLRICKVKAKTTYDDDDDDGGTQTFIFHMNESLRWNFLLPQNVNDFGLFTVCIHCTVLQPEYTTHSMPNERMRTFFNLLFIVKQPFSVEKHMHSVFYYSCYIFFVRTTTIHSRPLHLSQLVHITCNPHY